MSDIIMRHPLYFEADYGSPEPSQTDRNSMYNAELYVMPWRRPRFGEETLLAKLRGLYITPTAERSFGPALYMRVIHDTARDQEHDALNLTRIVLENPTLESLIPAHTVIYATLGECYAYAEGDGPFIGQDRGFGGELSDAFVECGYCNKTHQVGQYLPSDRQEMKDLRGVAIRMVLSTLD